MSAAVLALPTAVSAPVVQRRRRGPLPKAVSSLKVYREACMREQHEVDAANIEGVKNLCCDLLRRAMQGEVKGLIVIESKGSERITACATGTFSGRTNRARLVQSARWLAEVVADDPGAERQS